MRVHRPRRFPVRTSLLDPSSLQSRDATTFGARPTNISPPRATRASPAPISPNYSLFSRIMKVASFTTVSTPVLATGVPNAAKSLRQPPWTGKNPAHCNNRINSISGFQSVQTEFSRFKRHWTEKQAFSFLATL